MEGKTNNGDIFDNTFSKSFISSHKLICSEIPELCKTEPCILGVDEAGRGPVLGPMVYGISFCPISKKDEFSDLGCADSKALTEKKREEVFSILCACDDYVGWAVDVISPSYISNSMLRRAKHSLNEVAADSTVSLIKKAIEDGVNVCEIYVDTVGPPEKYQDRLSKVFPECKVTVAKKADALFPIVSAASICAKVCRDRVISNWKFSEAIDVQCENYGSGYPADPNTKTFLSSTMDDVFGFPNIVRFSWSTASNILENSSALVEWDEEEKKVNIATFFKKNTDSHTQRHTFFTENLIGSINFF